MTLIVISIWLGFSWLALDLWFRESRHHRGYHKEVTLDHLLKGEGM